MTALTLLAAGSGFGLGKLVGTAVVLGLVVALALRFMRQRSEGGASSRTPLTAAAMRRKSPGWYPDPEQPGALRWWDGAEWTMRAPARSL